MTSTEYVEFGDPILRKRSTRLKIDDIQSQRIKNIIQKMKKMLLNGDIGVGLAAPQIGESLAVSVIIIRPTKYRPKLKKFEQVIINPSYKGNGVKNDMWEGCLSAGKSGLFAKTPRFKKINAVYFDDNGKKHDKTLTGLKAQVFQHETDHLNGRLFVDIVEDTKSYMTYKEYEKRIKSKNAKID